MYKTNNYVTSGQVTFKTRYD